MLKCNDLAFSLGSVDLINSEERSVTRVPFLPHQNNPRGLLILPHALCEIYNRVIVASQHERAKMSERFSDMQ